MSAALLSSVIMASADSEIILRQSTVGKVGAARVGVGNVAGEKATLHVSRLDAPGGPSVKLKVRTSELAPFAGAFHRVVAVRDAGPASMPGGSRSEVRVAAKPEPGAPALKPDGLVVPVQATASIGGFDLSVVEVAADGSATLEVWPGQHARLDTDPELIERVTVKKGGAVPVGDKQLVLLAVIAADPAKGLPACVELGL
jgi:hypothetical protein